MAKFISILFFGLLAQTSFSQESAEVSDLRWQIDSIFNATQGDFAIAFKDLSGSEDEILINEKEEFHAASTMKTPVMIEVFKQAAEGKFSLTDSLLVENEFKSIVDGSSFSLDITRDSSDKIYSQLGQKKSIKDLMVDMIIHSSNLATNIIVELVDAKQVTQTLREMGAKDIMVLRGVEDIKAYDQGLNNTTTANDLMLIFEQLAKKEMVSKAASEEMLEVLLRQTHNNIIPALLPENVKVAHKTGSITGVAHDSGIVILPNGEKYVLVLLSKNMKNSEKGVAMMAQISRMIYDYVTVKNKVEK